MFKGNIYDNFKVVKNEKICFYWFYDSCLLMKYFKVYVMLYINVKRNCIISKFIVIEISLKFN